MKAKQDTFNNLESCKYIENLPGNFKYQVKAVFSDIDDTIKDLKKRTFEEGISKNTFYAAKMLNENSIMFVLCSGRTYEESKGVAEYLNMANQSIITLQGAEIRTASGITIYQNSIILKDALNILKTFEITKKQHNLNSKIIYYIKGKPYSNEKFTLPFNWEEINLVIPFDIINNDNLPSKILVYEDNIRDLNLICNILQEKYPEYNIKITINSYLEIVNSSTSKGTAIEWFARQHNLDFKNIAVIGDGINDIEMFETVNKNGGLSIAMGNAVDELKKCALFITDTIYNDGFKLAIESIIDNNLCIAPQ